MNKYRELAAAIRKGHTMIRESHTGFLVNGCGCAIGAAWVGAGKTEGQRFEVDIISATAELFSLPEKLIDDISLKHSSGIKRLAIADWLDTLADEVSEVPQRETDKAYATRKVAELMALAEKVPCA